MKGLEIPGGWGVHKEQKFKEVYEVEWEFPEGWGALIKNPFRGGDMDILYGNYAISRHVIFYESKLKYSFLNLTQLGGAVALMFSV